jgi:hypothetical protein
MRSHLLTVSASAALALMALTTFPAASFQITALTDVQQSADTRLSEVGSLSVAERPAGNVFNPSNPQDRSGNSNPQDMTQPRSFNPQDME